MTTVASSAKSFLAGLSKTVTGASQGKDAFVLYGGPGMGKTSLAAQCGGGKPVLFVIDGSDNGYADLVRNGQLPAGLDPILADSWATLRATTKSLIEVAKETPPAERPFNAVAFENLGGFESLLQAEVIKKYQKSPAKGDDSSYDSALIRYNAWGGQGVKDGLPEWESWLRDIVTLGSLGIRPLLLGHSLTGKLDSADQSAAYARVVLALHPKLSEVVDRLMGNIALLGMRATIVVKGDSTKKARVDEQAECRYIKMHPSPQFQAKNRYGVTAEIDMGSSPKEAALNMFTAMGLVRSTPTPAEGK